VTEASMPDPIESAFESLGVHRKYNIGDLVRWAGELWYVDGYRYDAYRSFDMAFEDIEYSLSRVYTDGTWNDFAEVYQDDEDLRLICRAEYADEYLAYQGMDTSGGRSAATNAYIVAQGGAKVAARRDRREHEKAELERRQAWRRKSNELLDEYNRLIAEGDEEGARKIAKEWRERARIHEAGGEEWLADIFLDE